MNILYISHLSNVISEGPNYSVHNQIKAQTKFDNVFWYNLTDADQEMWHDSDLFHNINEYPSKNILDLPSPFNHPDLVIFESFYYIDDTRIAKFLCKKKIPYIIIPRSAFTTAAQNRKKFKKIVGNILFFKKMAKKAECIHYLSLEEYKQSGDKWNKKYFIAPNGIIQPQNKKTTFSIDKTGVCIGRFEPYQKGLDLFISAIEKIHDKILRNRFKFTFYGPERKGFREEFIREIKEKGLDDVVEINNGVFGKEKERVLLNSDFFFMTSRFEGLPMSLIEALSYGLPCLVTDGTNLRKEICDFKAGWGSKSESKEIEKAILKMMDEQDKFEIYGKNACLLSKEFDWEKIAENCHNHYMFHVKKM